MKLNELINLIKNDKIISILMIFVVVLIGTLLYYNLNVKIDTNQRQLIAETFESTTNEMCDEYRNFLDEYTPDLYYKTQSTEPIRYLDKSAITTRFNNGKKRSLRYNIWWINDIIKKGGFNQLEEDLTEDITKGVNGLQTATGYVRNVIRKKLKKEIQTIFTSNQLNTPNDTYNNILNETLNETLAKKNELPRNQPTTYDHLLLKIYNLNFKLHVQTGTIGNKSIGNIQLSMTHVYLLVFLIKLDFQRRTALANIKTNKSIPHILVNTRRYIYLNRIYNAIYEGSKLGLMKSGFVNKALEALRGRGQECKGNDTNCIRDSHEDITNPVIYYRSPQEENERRKGVIEEKIKTINEEIITIEERHTSYLESAEARDIRYRNVLINEIINGLLQGKATRIGLLKPEQIRELFKRMSEIRKAMIDFVNKNIGKEKIDEYFKNEINNYNEERKNLLDNLRVILDAIEKRERDERRERERQRETRDERERARDSREREREIRERDDRERERQRERFERERERQRERARDIDRRYKMALMDKIINGLLQGKATRFGLLKPEQIRELLGLKSKRVLDFVGKKIKKWRTYFKNEIENYEKKAKELERQKKQQENQSKIEIKNKREKRKRHRERLEKMEKMDREVSHEVLTDPSEFNKALISEIKTILVKNKQYLYNAIPNLEANDKATSWENYESGDGIVWCLYTDENTDIIEWDKDIDEYCKAEKEYAEEVICPDDGNPGGFIPFTLFNKAPDQVRNVYYYEDKDIEGLTRNMTDDEQVGTNAKYCKASWSSEKGKSDRRDECNNYGGVFVEGLNHGKGPWVCAIGGEYKISENGKCGIQGNYTKCNPGDYCSKWGWCGTTQTHKRNSQIAFNGGPVSTIIANTTIPTANIPTAVNS